MFRQKQITYALGGGGAYGFSHIGAIKYLESLSIYPSAICGTSIGALIGGLYAFGMKINEIEKMAKEIDIFKMIELLLRPGISKGGVIDSYKIKEFFYKYIGDIHINELNIPFVAIARDSRTGVEVDIYDAPLIDAIISSISVPTTFIPYYYNGRYLVDGGLSNNIPMDIARHFSKYVIGINVIPTLSDKNECIEKEKKMFVKSIKKERKKLIPLNFTYSKKNKQHSKIYYKKIIDFKYKDKQKEKYTLADSIANTLSIENQNQLNRIKIDKNNIVINIQGLEDYTSTGFNKASEIIKIGYEYVKDNHHLLTRFL